MSDPLGFSIDPDLEERVYEWESDRSRYATAAEWRSIQAHREPPTEREEVFLLRLAESPTCDVCGGRVILGGTRHHSCAPMCQRCWRPKTNCFCR